MSATAFDVFAYRVEHEVRISQDRRVVEPQNCIVCLRQPGVTVGVAFFMQAMNAAIGLDDQLQSVAGEVSDIGTDRNLSSELDAMQPSIPQQGP